MANIKPISDLRNYNTVLKDCALNSPVFLTKNGRGKYVILDVEQYDSMLEELRLLNEIAISEQRVKNGEKCLNISEIKNKLGI